jgi:hypothetical protein
MADFNVIPATRGAAYADQQCGAAPDRARKSMAEMFVQIVQK